jgi:hypothetical protein
VPIASTGRRPRRSRLGGAAVGAFVGDGRRGVARRYPSRRLAGAGDPAWPTSASRWMDGVVSMLALYRRHSYVTRAYGNFLGLVPPPLLPGPRERSTTVGNLLVVTGHATVDAPGRAEPARGCGGGGRLHRRPSRPARDPLGSDVVRPRPACPRPVGASGIMSAVLSAQDDVDRRRRRSPSCAIRRVQTAARSGSASTWCRSPGSESPWRPRAARRS